MNDPYQAPASPVQGSMINCKGCSKEIHAQATLCPSCGLLQRSRGYKNKNMAGALAMLIGGLGVHRFYLGQWWGIFYILLCWTGIPSIVSFIEAFVLWFSDVVSWDRKYNEGKPAGPSEKGGAGLVVLLVIAGVFAVGFISIISKATVPAYKDYKVREKVIEALGETVPAKGKLLEYYYANDLLPGSNADIELPRELPSGAAINVFDSGLVLTFGSETPELVDKDLELTPVNTEDGIEWDCTGGSLETKFRPSKCRASDD